MGGSPGLFSGKEQEKKRKSPISVMEIKFKHTVKVTNSAFSLPSIHHKSEYYYKRMLLQPQSSSVSLCLSPACCTDTAVMQ